MAPPVLAIWSVVRMPATSGIQPAGRDRRDASGCNMLIRVDDEALADERVQRLVGDPGGGWLAHDVPDEDLVVGTGERVIVLVDAYQAFQPPVRRVQPVGVVLA